MAPQNQWIALQNCAGQILTATSSSKVILDTKNRRISIDLLFCCGIKQNGKTGEFLLSK